MKSYQFFLRTLLAAFAVGLVVVSWISEPAWQIGAIDAVLSVWVPASVLVFVVNSRGIVKTWWIGVAAEVMWATTVFFAYWLPENKYYPPTVNMPPLDYRESLSPLAFFLFQVSNLFRPLLLAWAFAPVVGLLCVLTHWLFIRPPEPKA